MNKKELWIKALTVLVLVITGTIGGMIMLLNTTFGNYNSTVYDIFVNPILWLLYVVSSVILFQIAKRVVENKKLYFLFLTPILFVFVSNLNGGNIYKEIILEGEVDDHPFSSITFFDNQTFEIRIQYHHVTEYKKGKFERIKNEFVLKEVELEKMTGGLYTNRYIFKRDSILEPIEKEYKEIRVYKK